MVNLVLLRKEYKRQAISKSRAATLCVDIKKLLLRFPKEVRTTKKSAREVDI
jgi:hypothetical protein